MKKQILLASLTLMITGCVSDSDIQPLRDEITNLKSEQGKLRSDVSSLKSDLAFVKEQRVIRLPIGSPTVTETRNKPTMSEEEIAFQSAENLYKSGDTDAAILAFEQFNNNYPNSSHLSEVLYSIGEASYSKRDYSRAEQVLEQLIYQDTSPQPNQKAINLLKEVYKADGKTQQIKNLESFLQGKNLYQ